ncbi:MAG: Ig-like domain-containing protein, partial [Chlorobium sp.]|nr:Ig-like domain-containing protein [Chlorobium sp.]
MNTEITVASNIVPMHGANLSDPVLLEHGKVLDRRSLVIAAAGIKDVDVLLGHLDQGADLLRVDSSADFGTLLRDALNGGYERLHFLGHGQSGEIRFGDRALQVEDFTAVSPGKGNVKTPSLHFWSCMTGAGVKGRAFVDGIAKAFGAAVTAFSDLVGAKGLGGSWAPDVCSRDAGFVGTPFVRALAYQHTLQTSVLELKAVPTATGEDVQVWLKGGTVVNNFGLDFTYDTTKATCIVTWDENTGISTGAVLSSNLSTWSFIPNQPTAGHLSLVGYSTIRISGSSDVMLATISFTLAGSTGSGISTDQTTYLQLDDTAVPLGTLPELKPPTVLTFNPVDASIGFPVADNIVLTFTEAIQNGTGLIEIHSGSATGALVESFDAATSLNLLIRGSELTINPTENLATETHYFVTFAAGSIKDMAGNSYSGTSTYDFTTAPPVNDFAPVLSVDNANVSLAENAVAGPITGADADATDADGNTVMFSLVNEPVTPFSIDSSTGQISLTAAGAAAIDYESSTKSYALTVKASDGLTAHDQTATVTINLTNVNDNSPVFTSGATGSVAENAATSTVIYTAVTTDADNLAAPTYT